ncbi:uncharacterized protein F4822DRAFT_407531 [Hypoxylon trugodes]|uniref:uncharacterized protein n=1 Tax=Hypoxylon trugodes TaxID=326681 RepID=UPI0021A1DB53|nr:uncharacterized protein F4822DRAFT_407531 [Hypoxylon trugodes]KAI1387771.1 hypothetical protein F4822DRAFT_407531 [Hypoxylon trugodes]
MASFAVSTPSPPGRVRTPGTPKHGYTDSWDPYSTPRKSARISAQRSQHRTPSPRASTQRHNRVTARVPSDPFDTPNASPQKKRQPAMDSVRRANGALTFGSSNAGDSIGNGSSRQKPKANATSQNISSMMLPTPAKTPQKQPDEKSKAKVRAVARNLFSDVDADADIIVNPKKRKTKKYSGITLNSFTAEEIEEPIEIFTDSRDRVPEVDREQNPFYNNLPSSADSETSKRIRAKQVSIPGEGRQTVDEALERKDGIIYVFRGKKIFRKFSSEDGEEEEDITAESSSAKSPERPRPLTRSSIKPRLLFPANQKGKAATQVIDEDEEAVTDIEDHVLVDAAEEEELASAEEPATPNAAAGKKPETPVAPRFAPVSPPSTVRATRASTKLRATESPMKATKPRSPFDGWRRSKSRAGPQGQKREGDELVRPSEVAKRQRA